MAIDYEDDEPAMLPHDATIQEQVRLLMRDTRAHARSISEIVKLVHEHDGDIKSLGKWQMERLVAEAREEERDKALNERLDRIDQSIKGVKEDVQAGRGIWIKLLLIVAVPVISAAVYGIAMAIVHGQAVFG